MCEKIFELIGLNMTSILGLFTYFGLCTLFNTDQCHKKANKTVVERTDGQSLFALISMALIFFSTKNKFLHIVLRMHLHPKV